MNCSRALDGISSYLDGERAPEEGRPIEDHLETCASCLARAGEMAEVHRDLALRSVRREMNAHDPLPAMTARVRWTAALSRRSRRAAPAPAGDRRLLWLLLPLAAGLVLAVVGVDRTPAARKAVRPEPAPLVESPLPGPELPAPAPRRDPAPPPETPPLAPRPVRLPEAPVQPPPAVDPIPSPVVPAPTRPEAPTAIARAEQAGRPSRPVSLGETLAADAPLVVLYPDGTRLFVSAGTTLTLEGRGKTVSIACGEVFADVAPQPKDDPAIFTTAAAEIKVVGTWLSVAGRPEGTLVTVERGRVQVTRKSDRWSVPLREGQAVSIEAGRLPQARPLAPNLVADPGFEADGKGWEGIFNRTQGRNFGGISVTSEVTHSDGRAVQLITQPTPGYDREVYQDFPVAPGDGVEASGWIRTTGIGGKGVSLSLLWLSGAGNLAGDLSSTVRMKGLVLREDVAGVRTGTTEWTRLATRVVAPAHAKQVRLLLYADVDPEGPATAWFDDLSLRRIPKGR